MNEENINKNNKELTLSEIQGEALKVLIKFDSLCKEHNWTYYIAYGTLIGAVRHQGFIPWDDDVDVQMPRKDFTELTEWCVNHEKELYPFKLCSVKTIKNYPYGLSRFANMQYKYETTSKQYLPFDIGIFIDIYPLDNYGNTYEEGLKICKKTCHLNYLLYEYYSGLGAKNFFKDIRNRVIHFGLKCFCGKTFPQKNQKKIEDFILKNTSDSDKFLGVPSWTGGCYQFEKIWFKEKIQLLFAGHYFYAPSNYHELLTFLYGNYMELPPEKDRMPSHEYKIYKRDKSF